MELTKVSVDNTFTDSVVFSPVYGIGLVVDAVNESFTVRFGKGGELLEFEIQENPKIFVYNF